MTTFARPPRNQILARICPLCVALPGDPCTNLTTGEPLPRHVHVERTRAAERHARS